MKYTLFSRTILFAFLLILSTKIFSQTFTEQAITLPGINNGTSKWGDYDNDGDLDILVAGYSSDPMFPLVVKLYRNNGSNSFIDQGSIFNPAFPAHYYNYNSTSALWVDFDNDGFLDILYNSTTPSGANILLIYKNEGNNTFTLKMTLNYLAVQTSTLDWGDYDNDGDNDFILNSNSALRLFQNQGSFSFSEQSPIAPEGLSNGTVSFGDYDNDSDLDIIVSGLKNWSAQIQVYKNLGKNSFAIQSGMNLPNTNVSSTEWGDYNNDGLPDLLLAGYGNPVFKNNGNNTFSSQYGISNNYFSSGTGKWGDFDNDGDLDVITSGDSYGTISVNIFFNNGNNTFTIASGITIDAVKECSIDAADYDNDGDLDILISGNKGATKITKVYKNETASVNTAPTAPTNLSATISDSDIILKWKASTDNNTSKKSISYNISAGTTSGTINIISPNSSSTGFRRIPGIGNAQLDTTFILRNLKKGPYYWKVQAIDNNSKGSTFSAESYFNYSYSYQAFGLSVPAAGAKEATLSWSRGNGTECIVFLKEANTGNATPANNTTYSASTTFKTGTQINTSGWYCVAKGNLTTVNVTGLKANTDYIFQVLEFEGTPGTEAYNTQSYPDNPLTFKTGTFTEAKTANLSPVNVASAGIEQTSSSFWIDFDNDNDLDLLLTGMESSKLYRNDLNDIFTLMPVSLPGSVYGATCGDFNNDGWIDIITSSNPMHLYRNNGNSTFTDIAGHGLPGINYGSVSSCDYDNDGDLDVSVTGETSLEGRITKVYKNNGNNTFTEQTSIVLPGVNGVRSIAKWGDFDNDGYADLIVSGYDNSATFINKVYHNTGNNLFTEIQGLSLAAQFESSFDWGDYDNDGDLDLLVATSGANSLVYKNEGNNLFTLQTGINLIALRNGSGIWGDYDSDGDLDILICGSDGWYNPFTRIYRNDGNNVFTEEGNSKIPGAHSGSAAWGDYDNDGDLDYILTGNDMNSPVARIFRNDLNIINAKPAAPAGISATVNKSDVTLKWNPVKNDNTPYKALSYNLRVGTSSTGFNVVSPAASATGFRRIVTTGNGYLDTVYTLKKLPFGDYYWSVQAIDNGYAGGTPSSEGMFSIIPVQAKNLSATIKSSTSLLLKWERGNGDRCVVFCKQTSSGSAIPVNTTTYAADDEFGFGTQVGSSGWYCIYNGRADSVTVTGLAGGKMYSFHIFEYNGNYGGEQYFTQVADGNPGVFSTSLFTEQTAITLNTAPFNNVEWGDYDNDGFIDFVVPGFPTRIYKNNGNNSFTEKTTIALVGVTNGGASWGDYDNDEDLDLLITGGSVNTFPPTTPVTKLYRNDGADVFSEQTGVVLPQVYYSSAEWGDYDNDGDPDILLTGATGNDPDFNPVSRIFENNGNGTFTEKSQITLPGVYRGSGKWIDFDSDGDLDISLIGALSYETQWSSNGVFKLYLNNGNKSFTEKTQDQIQGYSNAAMTWGDFDNDGDPDLITTSLGYFRLYQNNGSGTFSQHIAINLPYQNACASAWGDYDNDGYLDFILSNPGLDTKIYHNTHGISVPGAISQWFNRQDDNALGSIGYGFVNWIDYDNDGDIDFLMGKYGLPTKIFKNNTIMKSGLFKTNNAPAKPSGLTAINTPSGVLLKWNPVNNDETPQKTMSYNIGIGTTKTLFNKTATSSAVNGYRKLPSMGNAQLDTTHFIKNLPPQKFYWHVQAVDQSFKGGAWSSVDSFQVKNVLAFFTADTVCQGLNTTFANQSVGFGETIQSYKWIFENGATSVLANPTYTFGSAGVKNVTLIAYSSTTSDTLVKQVLVKAKPLLDFSASVACVGTETTLTNLSNVAGLTITSWSWDYGDGKGSAAMNPGTHGYLNPGDYEVILTAAADNNCSESITKSVSVAAYPIASVSATTPLSFCSGDSVSLSVASYTNHTYRWISNGVDVTGGNTNRITARNTGNYTVEVTNLTGNCKTTSSPAAVTVLGAPAAPLITAPAFTTICDKDSVLLKVSNTTGYSYLWKLNGGAIGSNSSQFYAKNSGTYTITVSNSNGCSVSSTNQITITVNALPVVSNISLSGNDVKFCRGESITLSVPQNADYSYNWRRGATDLGLTTNSITANEKGDYSVVISSQFNCKAASNPVSIYVVEKPAEPAIDHGSYKSGDCLKESPLRLSVKDVVPEYTYKWYKNGTPVGNSTFIETREEGKYYVESIYDICKSDTASIDIHLQPTMPKPAIVVKGSNVWYLSTTSKASLYKWYFNGVEIQGAATSTYVAGQNMGLYRVAVSDGSGCYAYSDTVRIKGTGITGIEDMDPFKTLVVYPNPSSGVFNLEMNNNLMGKLTVRIFNQDGKKVFDREFEKNEEKYLQQIDIGQQRIGLYLISLYINGQFSNTKFIIE